MISRQTEVANDLLALVGRDAKRHNEQAHLPAGHESLQVPETRHALPVRCSACSRLFHFLHAPVDDERLEWDRNLLTAE